MRTAIRILRENGVVSMFPDEARNGQSYGPLSRSISQLPPRLARMTSTAIQTVHCRPAGPCRFALTFEPLLESPDREAEDILADVVFLNMWIEPIVAAAIPDWYFLDDYLAPIKS